MNSRFCPPAEAAHVLRSGGIIAFPTETHYGLGVDPTNPEAVEKLFRLKERDRGKPILLLVKDLIILEQVITFTPTAYNNLMEKYWPGPLTLIFPAKKSIHSTVTANTGKVGVRISSNETVKRLFEFWKGPVTATSANKSGSYPAQNANEILEIFGDEIDCVVDGGSTPGGPSSTIVDYEEGKLKIIRPGRITLSGEDMVSF